MNVTFDRKSLLIDGRRVFLRGGAFHYFRLPAPGLWRDRLLKIKRAGYNAVDLYFPWSYHSEAPGHYDFTGIRDVDYLLDLVEETGLYLIARPSPFVNAELSGGGTPTWLLRRHDVPLRCLTPGAWAHCDSPEYLRHVREWQEQIVPRVARRGNLVLFQIENEYLNDDLRPDYMRFLYDLARELGVRVPIFHNDGSNMGAWADLADIYSVDSYPITDFSADWRGRPELFQMLDNIGNIYEGCAPASPRFVAELQGGWFDAWTGIGYDQKRRILGPEAMNTITWSVVAQGCTLYNHFMFVGGTNWDRIGCPCVHTSYDFAAPVHEWGGVSERYTAAKQIAHQISALEPWLCEAEPAGDVTADQPDLLYRVLGAGEARFCFLRNLSAQPRATALSIEGREVPPVEVAPGDTRLAIFHLQQGPVRISYASAPLFAWLAGEAEHEFCFTGAGVVAWRAPHKPAFEENQAVAWWSGGRVLVAYDGAAPEELTFRLAPKDGGVLVRAHFLPDASRAWLVDGRLVLGPEYAGEVREGRLETYERARPAEANLPDLRWRVRGEDALFGPTVDDGAWETIAAGSPADMDALGIDGGIVVYRGRFQGPLAAVSLALRHTAALYLDGRFVARLDDGYASHPTEGEVETEPVPPLVRVPLDAGPGSHTLMLVVESLGHNKGYVLNERFPRGLLAWASEPPAEIEWSARAGLPGEDEYTAPEFDDAAWQPVTDLSQAPGEVAWARARFRLDLPPDLYAPVGLVLDGAADKAHIYLNGVLIGRHWSVCPQHKYYLPEGLLDQHGENVLALALWRRGGAPAAGDVRLETYGAWRVTR